jgi:hypothetical protein
MFSRQTADLGELTEGVLSEDIQFHAERLRLWRTEIALASITGDEEGLRRAELRIIPSSWFRKWLCFCLRNFTQSDHRFHLIPISDFRAKRSSISFESDHGFHVKPITDRHA